MFFLFLARLFIIGLFDSLPLWILPSFRFLTVVFVDYDAVSFPFLWHLKLVELSNFPFPFEGHVTHKTQAKGQLCMEIYFRLLITFHPLT